MCNIKNKVVVITGGNSGIGKGIAKHFYEQGAKVVITGRDDRKLKEVKQEIGSEILTIQADVLISEDIKKIYHETSEKFGKIDTLIVNSGVGERLHVEDVTEEKFDYMVDINYRGAYFTVKYALEYLNTPASIILIGSCAATVNVVNHSVYSSSKAAIVKLAKSLANDLANRSIRVNCISPGYIETPIFQQTLQTDSEFLSRKEAHIPLRRIGQPKDIAEAALFLASDQASYITGVDLLVDGGYASAFREN